MELLASAVSTIVLAALLLGPWILLALMADRFGVDSRPGIGDPRVSASQRWI